MSQYNIAPEAVPAGIVTQTSGAFTPTLLFGGAAVGMTGTFTGFYVKSNLQVDIMITITLTAKGSSTGNASIGGLPFSTNGTAGARKYLPMYLQNCTANGSTFTTFAAQAGSATVTLSGLFEFSQASDLAIAMDQSNFDNDAVVIITGTYWAAS